MKVVIRQPSIDANGNSVLLSVEPWQMIVEHGAIIAIDGATSNSGVGILRKADGAIMYSIAVTREKDESPVKYKLQFKELLKAMLRRFKLIDHIAYEEPIIGYVTSVANLMMLKTMVAELLEENKAEFSYVTHNQINNKRWKKEFVAPAVLPNNTEKEKKLVREKLESYIPCLKDVTQDEIDALAMGFVVIRNRLAGKSDEELQSKKSTKPFKYEIDFYGGDSDDDVIEEFFEQYNGPKGIIDNGIRLSEIGPRANFDKFIYSEMGEDDMILIVKFPSDKHSNIVLQYRLGSLTNFDYIYAFVWRKNRKR